MGQSHRIGIANSLQLFTLSYNFVIIPCSTATRFYQIEYLEEQIYMKIYNNDNIFKQSLLSDHVGDVAGLPQ